MSKRRESMTELLQSAVEQQTPVRIKRAHDWEASDVQGFVVALTKRWVVMSALADGVYSDGVVAIRRKHITDVVDRSENGFIERAVSVLGRPSVTFTVSDDARMPDVLRAASAHSPLITVFTEKKDPYACLIGHITEFGEKTFDMQLIGPEGIWTATSSRFKYKHVTWVEVGDRYSAALHGFGDPRPDCVGHSEDDPCSC